ncbi:hypothetical protein ACRAQ7_00430 [Erythrobacter sp. W53]|uniref:hypothetical protein n=1 Tax=Erythrobacter sp. W53 TaxID=3425947 RepID=UPI003D76726D
MAKTNLHLRALLASALTSMMLSGCATSDTDYPSLATRDFERAEGQFEAPAARQLNVPELPTDFTGDLTTHLANLLEQARLSHTQFETSLPSARSQVAAARGLSAQDDRWSRAAIALGGLDASRSQTAIVLADLDTLYTAAAIQYENVQAIADTRAQVAALILLEDRALADLRGDLGGEPR